MSDIRELRQNIERLTSSANTVLRRQSYDQILKNIENIESELNTSRKEIEIKNRELEQLKKENMDLKHDYTSISRRVEEITKEKAETEKKLEQLSRTRYELSSSNLVKAFRDSIENMEMSLSTESSKKDYHVSSMNIRLKTNIAVRDEEISFQLPKADDVIPPGNLSEIEFSITSLSKDSVFSDYVDVPDVVGMNLDIAQSKLENAGFAIGEILETESELAQGTVISQIPSGNSVAKPGEPVDLVISKIRMVEVPNVVGMNLKSARRILKEGRLDAGKITEREDSSNTGTVLNQSVSPGEHVDTGSNIDLDVAVSEKKMNGKIIGKDVNDSDVKENIRNSERILSGDHIKNKFHSFKK
ncbi:PASTA domain containing protein [Methanosalsum zhilinae DSM 4017]|uniref:PASTA domain containing protein n=1 Tax=Methanosalsum zhilinae (strain DSM 4017 / NBRC 107636 / OCM 62 / WeN5) TaxID=679901 RepID=F7XNU2_METZD|nr:PASTA domain-containing protein [Methanosalsum zhilinae]AEH61298.1 PASTA domain containing protein [Methanosalsum zhilinae DSM 4017]